MNIHKKTAAIAGVALAVTAAVLLHPGYPRPGDAAGAAVAAAVIIALANYAVTGNPLTFPDAE